MGFSHRDHRTHRTIRRGTLVIVLAIVALTVFAVLIPQRLLGLVAVGALGIAGGVYALHAHRVVESYLEDLERVRTGEPLPAEVRVEAGSDIGLDRRTVGPTTRSPNARRPSVPGEEPVPEETEAPAK
jgi:hypothetical protein